VSTGSSSYTLEVVVPVAEFQDMQPGTSRHASREGITGKRALLLPSEKTSSVPFVEILVRRMSGETAAQRIFTKRVDWAFFHPERNSSIAREMDLLATECDLMVSGVAY